MANGSQQPLDVLWVSMDAPYDTVPHAGGKVHNFYLKALHARGETKIQLVTFCHPEEVPKLDHESYGISAEVTVYRKHGIPHVFWGVLNRETSYNPYNRYGGLTNNFMAIFTMRVLKRYAEQGYKPQVIILQWTQIGLLADEIREVFPGVPVVMIEEDVAFQGRERRAAAAKGPAACIRGKQAIKLRHLELDAANKADLVIVNNLKDFAILRDNDVTTAMWQWTPYFQDYSGIERKADGSKDLLFYGAMHREENWKSALWFIDNVMPQLAPLGYKFVVVGINPPKELTRRACEYVEVTGFVEDATQYFARSLCLAAPLQFGAGVKIKVIEALSAGLPVLTNGIGIEGINAQDGKDYLHCKTAAEYVAAVQRLSDEPDLAKALGRNARAFVDAEFSYKNDAEVFCDRIRELGIGGSER